MHTLQIQTDSSAKGVPSICSDRYIGGRWWLPLFYLSEVGCPDHGLFFLPGLAMGVRFRSIFASLYDFPVVVGSHLWQVPISFVVTWDTTVQKRQESIE
jgi:hypothetical protein